MKARTLRWLAGGLGAAVVASVIALQPPKPKPEPEPQPVAVQSRADCRIKGNVAKSGELIYHMPGQRYYNRTNPEQWFCTEEEARKAGFRRSKV